jgi:hypothetical protein
MITGTEWFVAAFSFAFYVATVACVFVPFDAVDAWFEDMADRLL